MLFIYLYHLLLWLILRHLYLLKLLVPSLFDFRIDLLTKILILLIGFLIYIEFGLLLLFGFLLDQLLSLRQDTSFALSFNLVFKLTVNLCLYFCINFSLRFVLHFSFLFDIHLSFYLLFSRWLSFSFCLGTRFYLDCVCNRKCNHWRTLVTGIIIGSCNQCHGQHTRCCCSLQICSLSLLSLGYKFILLLPHFMEELYNN